MGAAASAPSVVLLIGVIIDQTSIHSLAQHVEALYAPHGLHPDPNVLAGYLYLTGAVGIVLWPIAIRGASGRKRWVPVVATIVFLVGAILAVFTLVVSEYETPLFPTLRGVLGLLPSVAGLTAVIVLWASRRAKAQS